MKTLLCVLCLLQPGLATYEIPSLNRSGEIPLQRIVEDRVPLCESLAAP